MAHLPDERTRRYVAMLDQARGNRAEQLNLELAPLRTLSLAERGKWVADACAAAVAIMRSPSRVTTAIARDEPPAADLAATWQRLMARQRASRRQTT